MTGTPCWRLHPVTGIIAARDAGYQVTKEPEAAGARPARSAFPGYRRRLYLTGDPRTGRLAHPERPISTQHDGYPAGGAQKPCQGRFARLQQLR